MEEAQERDRKAREERARVAREMQATRDRIAIQKAEEEKKQQKLRNMGVCVQGFKWLRDGAGYRCAGDRKSVV